MATIISQDYNLVVYKDKNNFIPIVDIFCFAIVSHK